MTRSHYGCDCMVIGFTTTYAINAYHHKCCDFKFHTGWPWGVSVTCGRSAVFSCTLVSSTNKTDCHDITDLLLKVALNTTKPNQSNQFVPIYLILDVCCIFVYFFGDTLTSNEFPCMVTSMFLFLTDKLGMKWLKLDVSKPSTCQELLSHWSIYFKTVLQTSWCDSERWNKGCMTWPQAKCC